MTTLLDTLPNWLLGLLIIGGSTGLAIGIMLVLRERIKRSMKEMHNDVAGYVFAVVGVLYALLLGFVILSSWERFEGLQADVEREGTSLTSLYEMSVGLPPSTRPTAQVELRRYAELVINDEWDAMAHGHSSPRVDASLNRLFTIYSGIGREGVQDNVDSQSLQNLNEISSLRTLRVLGSTGALDAVFWAVVLLGGVCTLAFAVLFYLENAGIQIVMMAILAALISSMIFLLIILDHAFSGG